MFFQKQILGKVVVTALLVAGATSFLTKRNPGYFELVVPAIQYEFKIKEQYCSKKTEFWHQLINSIAIILEPDSFETAMNISELGLHHYDKHHYKEAAELFKLVLNRKVCKKELFWYAAVKSNLAKTYHYRNQLNEAEPLYRESIKLRQQCFYPDSRVLVQPMINLACVLIEQNRCDEAEEWLNKALSITKKNENLSRTTAVNWEKQELIVETRLLSIAKMQRSNVPNINVQKALKSVSYSTFNGQKSGMPLEF